MKKLHVLLILLLSLTACSKQIISDKGVLLDIETPKWRCSHGAEQRELELVDTYLYERTGASLKLAAVYNVKHLEDNLFKLSSLTTAEVTKLKKDLGNETNTQHSDLVLTIDVDNKDLYINAYPEDDNLEQLKNIDVGHGCELIERIQ